MFPLWNSCPAIGSQIRDGAEDVSEGLWGNKGLGLKRKPEYRKL